MQTKSGDQYQELSPDQNGHNQEYTGVRYISIPVSQHHDNLNPRNSIDDSTNNMSFYSADDETHLNDSSSMLSSSSSLSPDNVNYNGSTSSGQNQDESLNNCHASSRNKKINRKKSILEYPIGSFKGVNSLNRFATSLRRAHSFKAIELNNDIERSYFNDANDELYDPNTLAPSHNGRRLSVAMNQAIHGTNVVSNLTKNKISSTPLITNVEELGSNQDISFTGTNYGAISKQPSQASLLRHSFSITNPLKATNNINDLPHENSLIVKRVQDKDGKVLTVLAGQSTAPQTIFNSINVLIGLGLLALPLGLKHAGWILGLSLLMLFAFGTFCSAELLSRCLDTDPTLISYADLAYAAFGPKGRLLISFLFTLDLLGCGVSLIILFGDSLNAIFPEYSTTAFKVLGFFIVTPPVFLPLSILSNISLLGIISTIGTVILISISGLLKSESPGSLISPMPTNLWPKNFHAFCLSIGLLSACWGGHAVFPNLKSDMRHPEKFKDCLKTTYKITSITDIGTAILGFLMFGDLVLGEITTNVMLQTGYPKFIYYLLSALMSLIPIAKTPLNARPIISILDTLAGVQERSHIDEQKKSRFKLSLRVVNRIAVNATFVIVAILFPKFDKLIAFLGAGLCFTICLILPSAFYLKICKSSAQPWEVAACKFTIFVSIIFGGSGVIAAAIA